jgi:hypothetical protein
MARSKLGGLAAAVLGLLAWAAPAHAQNPVLKATASGDPQVKSIQAISFAPQGVLLIGDGKGRQLVAVETGDTTPRKWTRNEVARIDEQLAGRLGTTAKGIAITRLAVNPASGTAYIAVRMQDSKRDVLMTVDGTGKVGELALNNVKYARVKLPAAAPGDEVLITDVTWAGDRVLAAVQAKDTFASKIASVKAPLTNDTESAIYSTETYHVAHKRWETKAPIRTVMPYEQDGKKYLVGAFTCTPIVKFELDDLKPEAKVKGASVIEVGFGNEPRDMFTYTKGGKKYILMSVNRFFHKRSPVGPSQYWTVRVDADLLREKEKVNQKALWRTKGMTVEPATDRAIVVPSYHGVLCMDRLDTDRALVVRTDDKGNFDLQALPLP